MLSNRGRLLPLRAMLIAGQGWRGRGGRAGVECPSKRGCLEVLNMAEENSESLMSILGLSDLNINVTGWQLTVEETEVT